MFKYLKIKIYHGETFHVRSNRSRWQSSVWPCKGFMLRKLFTRWIPRVQALPCLNNVNQAVEGDNNLVFCIEKYQFGQQLRQLSRENHTEPG